MFYVHPSTCHANMSSICCMNRSITSNASCRFSSRIQFGIVNLLNFLQLTFIKKYKHHLIVCVSSLVVLPTKKDIRKVTEKQDINFLNIGCPFIFLAKT